MMVRAVALVVTLSFLVLPLAAETQYKAAKVPRIGVLSTYSPKDRPFIYALREGLRELGYVEGQSIAIEWQWAHGQLEQLPGLAANLVRLKVDVIVADNNVTVQAAQKSTTTIPIVMATSSDPVALGFVATLARPGANITGLSLQAPDIYGKRLELLQETVPRLSRVAIIWDHSYWGAAQRFVTEINAVAAARNVQSQSLEVRSPSDLEGVFATMTGYGVSAVVVLGSPMFLAHWPRIAELAVKGRLPTMCSAREYSQAGCLMSYGASLNDSSRRAAYFVDRILKGARPADIPVEQPTQFEFLINMKTAKALGLTIPPALLLRADRVIE